MMDAEERDRLEVILRRELRGWAKPGERIGKRQWDRVTRLCAPWGRLTVQRLWRAIGKGSVASPTQRYPHAHDREIRR